MLSCACSPHRFASMIDAFEGLPPDLAAAAVRCVAMHSFSQLHENFKQFTRTRASVAAFSHASSASSSVSDGVESSRDNECVTARTGSTDSLLSVEREASLSSVWHPLAPIHRPSNRQCLYLSPHAMASLATMTNGPEATFFFSVRDSLRDRELIDKLAIHATQSQFRYRHRWKPLDLVIWDNGCTMHAATAVPDEMAKERLMWRTTIQVLRWCTLWAWIEPSNKATNEACYQILARVLSLSPVHLAAL